MRLFADTHRLGESYARKLCVADAFTMAAHLASRSSERKHTVIGTPDTAGERSVMLAAQLP